MRLPGNPAQPPGDEPPLLWGMAFPAGATLAQVRLFVENAPRHGVADDALVVPVVQGILLVLLRCCGPRRGRSDPPSLSRSDPGSLRTRLRDAP